MGCAKVRLCRKRDVGKGQSGLCFFEKVVDATELAALLSPIVTITYWALAQPSAAPQRKKLSDLLEEPF
jgi:hypothetical protein